MKIDGKRVLITGGSSGIGRSLATMLLEKGAKVVINGRREGLLEKTVSELTQVSAFISSIAADVATPAGRDATLNHAMTVLGGLDVLVNNAGAVRAGRLENITENEIQQMIEVDLVAPILLTRSALPALKASGEALVVNIASGIALVGAPFYATYAATKAGLARFGEALRRELIGESVHILTVYPGATDTPMMASNRAGPELGFEREPASAVAQAVIAGIESDSLEIIRGGDVRAQMIALNRENPSLIDQRFLSLKAILEDAVREHSSL